MNFKQKVLIPIYKKLSYKFWQRKVPNIPDKEFYAPLFQPWLGYGEFKTLYQKTKDSSLVPASKCHFLYSLAKQALSRDGEIWECGVYKGGTAALLNSLIQKHAPETPLRLFDTFEGMPETDNDKDRHQKGDFNDTSLEKVKALVGDDKNVTYYKGLIPETFKGLDSKKIALAHIDVDIFTAIKDCCEFILPRLLSGGIIIFDDYGVPSCPGARKAVDEFFQDRKEVPIILPTGQALIIAAQ